MPFRPDVDLTGFIGDYEPWLDGTRQIEQAPSGNAPLIPETVVRPRVRLIHNGPITCSSSTVVDIPNRIVWDVNGWYAMLGADTRADRKALREAYISNRCWESVYATYVLQQLCIPEVRREYDAMPLGSQYLPDKFVQEMLKRKVQEEAARRARESGDPVDASAVSEVLGEMGYAMVPQGEAPSAAVPLDYADLDLWMWSYFLDDVVCHDYDRLAEWQEMVITALSEAGATLHFAVGFASQKNAAPQGFTRIEEASIMVAYLGAQTQPSRALAEKVAENLITQHTS